MVMLYAVDPHGNIVQEEYCQTKYSRLGTIKRHVGLLYMYCLSEDGAGGIKAEALNAQRNWVKIPHDSLPKILQMKILIGAL